MSIDMVVRPGEISVRRGVQDLYPEYESCFDLYPEYVVLLKLSGDHCSYKNINRERTVLQYLSLIFIHKSWTSSCLLL